MNDEATQNIEALAPRAKRKYHRRAKPIPVANPPPVEEFSGMTVFECCDICKARKAAGRPWCIITDAGTGFCAHPAKSALQHPDMLNQTVFGKYQRAKLEIANQLSKEKIRKGG